MSVILQAVGENLDQLDVVDGAILTVIASIIVWAVIRLSHWKASTPTLQQQSLSSPSASDYRSSVVEISQANVAVPVAPPKDLKNPTYMKQIQDSLVTIPEQLSDQVKSLMSMAFTILVENAKAEFERYNTKGTHSNEEIRNYVVTALEYDLQSIKAHLLAVSDRIGEQFVEGYKELLSQVFAALPDGLHLLKSNFMLSTDQAFEQRTKVTGFCRSHFTDTVKALEKLQANQAMLLANFPSFERQVSDETDWGGVLKSAVSGALVVVNPLIGVPSLLASVYGSVKKQDAETQSSQNYLWQVHNLYEQIIAIENDFNRAVSSSANYIHGKATESYVGALSYACKAIDDSGGSLKTVVPVFLSYTVK